MSKFDEALEVSFNAEQDYKQAVKDAESLVQELHEAVQKATGGTVSVEIRRAGWPPDQERADAEYFRSSTLGVDPEDHSATWVVVARGKDDERSLWEFTYSPNGYPITITTADASEIMCVMQQDLEQAFIELLRQGSTGRKIKVLQEMSTKQAS